MKCTFIVFRFDPSRDEKPAYRTYEIEAEPTDKILDCLNRIRAEQDPTLAYRASCAHGICGSDAMVINGRVALACQKLVKDYRTANNFVIEPLPVFRVLKDLIVDLDPFFEKHRSVRPLPHQRRAPAGAGADAGPRGAEADRPGAALHPVRLLHGGLPDLAGQPRLPRPGRPAARVPLHLRQPRHGHREPAARGRLRKRGLGLQDPVVVHRGLPQGHPGHQVPGSGQAGDSRNAPAP